MVTRRFMIESKPRTLISHDRMGRQGTGWPPGSYPIQTDRDGGLQEGAKFSQLAANLCATEMSLFPGAHVHSAGQPINQPDLCRNL